MRASIVTIREAKSNLSRLLRKAAEGEGWSQSAK
jgi:antitoxin (DNA-binding transcriptional repressor) of toxin-antitoxin stability system